MCVCVCGQGDVSVSGRGKGKEKSRVLGICLFGEIAKYKRYPLTRHLSLRFLTPSLLPSTSRLRVDTHRVLSFPRWMSISVRLSVSRSIKEQETRDEGQGVGYSWVGSVFGGSLPRGAGEELKHRSKTSSRGTTRRYANPRLRIRTCVSWWLNESERPLRVLPRSPLPCAQRA